MSVIAYLNFRNESEEALHFYEKALDGKDIRIMRLNELPGDPSHPLAENEKNLVANASMKFAGGMLMLSDVPESMGMPLDKGNNVSLSIVIKDSEEAKKYFENLSVDGNVVMPMMETPWSPLYGMVVDKFGIGWQINVTDDSYFYNM